MSFVRVLQPRHVGAVASGLLLTCVLSLAACSNTNRGVTGSVGVGIGVALTTPGGITQITAGSSIQISASITNDSANAGVDWSLPANSPFTLTDKTLSSVTLVAPASFPGEAAATVTATSRADTNFFSQVTIVALGTASFDQPTLFPANVNVAYAASFSISGGTQPFAWTVAAGSTLPPGLTLLGSTTGLDSLSGTPTTPGTYSFSITATDANGTVQTSQPVTLIVNPQATCVLVAGNYALMVSGFRGGGGMTHVANISIDAAGAITGEQDYKDGHRTTTHEVLTSTSNCINRQTNSGQITLNAASGALLYNVSVTPPDSTGFSQSARLQLIGSGSDTASGLLQRVDPTTIPAALPAEGFAFGLIGLTNQEPASVHIAQAGRFTTDASGNLSAGLIDSSASPALTPPATLSGSISAPDTQGRGTASFSVAGQTSAFVYYIVSNNAGALKMYLMNIDAQGAGAGTPRSTGFMSSQTGNGGPGVFDNTALSTPSILSLWGAGRGIEPITTQTMGRLSNSVAGSAGSGVVDAYLDITNRAVNLASQIFSAQPYTVDASGRGTLSITDSVSSYSLVFYLDGISNGYVVQQGTQLGSGGLLESQYQPAAGFLQTFPGFFVGGTQFAQAPGPITLNPLASINFGKLSSSFTNGLFYIDSSTGRGLGTLTQTGIGSQPAVMYVVSPTKIDLMRFSTRAIDGNIDWMIQN